MSAYLEVRDQIESGDIIAFEVSKYAPKISKFIKFFTKQDVYHIGIAVWMYSSEGDRRLFIIQAANGNRQVVPLSLYENETLQIWAAPCPFSNIAENALQRVGRIKYAYMDLISIWAKDNLKIPVKNWSGEVCSEMVIKIYGSAGINLGDKLTTPHAIINNLKNLGIKQKFYIRKED